LFSTANIFARSIFGSRAGSCLRLRPIHLDLPSRRKPIASGRRLSSRPGSSPGARTSSVGCRRSDSLGRIMNGRIPNPGVRPLHQGQPVAHAGAVVSRANAAMIVLHGRGASAEDILSLAQAFARPEIAYFAPQAAGHSWYPHSFLAPVADN